jgi:hypothetical protein
MAKFTKGQSGNLRGRPPGAKDTVPRTFRTCIKAVCEDIDTKNPELIRGAFEKGLRSAPPKSFQYLQLWAHYVSGKPADKVEVSGELRMPTIVNHFSGDRTDKS